MYWIDSILGELVPFEYFDLVRWFEIMVSGASYSRAVWSVRTAAVLVDNRFRR
jgi:hypothetical protein